MKQIRHSIFETNSSSVNALCISKTGRLVLYKNSSFTISLKPLLNDINSSNSGLPDLEAYDLETKVALILACILGQVYSDNYPYEEFIKRFENSEVFVKDLRSIGYFQTLEKVLKNHFSEVLLDDDFNGISMDPSYFADGQLFISVKPVVAAWDFSSYLIEMNELMDPPFLERFLFSEGSVYFGVMSCNDELDEKIDSLMENPDFKVYHDR